VIIQIAMEGKQILFHIMAGTIEIAESPVTHDSKIEYAYWTQAAADCVL
jgi:hypothetical protein